MVTMTERLERKVKRQKRHELLIEQTVVRKSCDSCPFHAGFSLDNCGDCSTFKQLKGIGDELIAMSRGSREQRQKETFDKIKEFGLTQRLYLKLKEDDLTDRYIASELGMSHTAFNKLKNFGIKQKSVDDLITVEGYNAYKGAGLTDADISKKIGISMVELTHWKRRKKIVTWLTKSKAHIVYDYYRSGRYVASGTVEELSELTGIGVKTLKTYRSRKHLEKVMLDKTKYSYLTEKEEQTC